MMKYKVYFIDDSKMKVSDLRIVNASRIKKVKQRKFLVFWKSIDWQMILKGPKPRV